MASQIVAVRHNVASHLDGYTQWSSVLAKLCLQPQQMCHKYCIRSQTAVNFEKYFYTFTFCIRTRSKWLNFILRQPTLR